MRTILNDIIDEFQNYGFSDEARVSQHLESLFRQGTLEDDNVSIQPFILPEVLILLNKAVLNRFAADLLFQKNYWSWGIVTLYYSNFFLSQALNRLKGDFFVHIPSLRGGGRRNIKLNDGQFVLETVEARFKKTHLGEFIKLKDNYGFMLTEESEYKEYLHAFSFEYESQIRNNVNYQLLHYQEMTHGQLKEGCDLKMCTELSQSTPSEDVELIDEFKLIRSNKSRFDLIFLILNDIKNKNSFFEEPFKAFNTSLSKQITYHSRISILRELENKYSSKKIFNVLSTSIEKQFQGYLL